MKTGDTKSWSGLAAVAVASAALVGCASSSQRGAAPVATTTAAPATAAATPDPAGTAAGAVASKAPAAKIVKSRDGKFDGEVIGTIAPGSKFSKLQIGMTMEEVSELIGTPNKLVRHETGKRWIPFYFGNDAQRMEVLYKGEGCLTYTAGNVFGGGDNELIRITVDAVSNCTE